MSVENCIILRAAVIILSVLRMGLKCVSHTLVLQKLVWLLRNFVGLFEVNFIGTDLTSVMTFL